MRQGTLVLVFALALSAMVLARWFRPIEPAGAPPKAVAAGPDVSPVCPWRDPPHDLLALFPPLTNYVVDARIVSRATAAIVKQLGRQMTPDENPLRIHRVQQDGKSVGSVLVTRVRGEHGGIEIVIGIDPTGAVKGLLIQSQREPDAVATAITGAGFLGAFAGKRVSSPLRLGEDLPELPAPARASGQAIAEGVHSQLVVLSFAETSPDVLRSGIHTNH